MKNKAGGWIFWNAIWYIRCKLIEKFIIKNGVIRLVMEFKELDRIFNGVSSFD